MDACTYSLEKRSANLGGGYRLRLLEDGEECGGGVFPLDAYEGPDQDRQAKADAIAEGEEWMATR